MSEQTTTPTTEEKKQLLWANVPWGVVNKETEELQITGNVADRYLVLALSKQLQTAEKKAAELEQKLKERKPDTTTTDVP
jgi:hypothetical protein